MSWFSRHFCTDRYLAQGQADITTIVAGEKILGMHSQHTADVCWNRDVWIWSCASVWSAAATTLSYSWGVIGQQQPHSDSAWFSLILYSKHSLWYTPDSANTRAADTDECSTHRRLRCTHRRTHEHVSPFRFTAHRDDSSCLNTCSENTETRAASSRHTATDTKMCVSPFSPSLVQV